MNKQMNILEQIVAAKRLEVQERKELYPRKLLERSAFFNTPTLSLKSYLCRKDKSGVIAEFKRKSPSKGLLNPYASVERTSIGYMQAGASALSVLTDQHYFGGANEDLGVARKFNFCPILRKEFIIDEYQILEARSLGADAVLLIAAVLTPGETAAFAAMAQSLQMEVVLEVHDEQELQSIACDVDIIGVNNRNLRTFETSIKTSLALAALIPGSQTKISESGITSPEVAAELQKAGFDGFLIGEQFMKHSRPDEACKDFIAQLNLLLHEN
jgi:indole-3-glycerol phosphate synthase